MDDEYSPFEFSPDEYQPYVDNYPYIGQDNVLGGGGRESGQDIYVPPQQNLSYGAVPASVQKFWPASFPALGIPLLIMAGVFVAFGYVVMPKIVAKFKN